MIKREHYLQKIRGFYNSDLIKIIVGIRRSGKSIILSQIKDEIKSISDNVIDLNFELKTTRNTINTADGLIEYVIKNKKDDLCYVFLDEVQELEDFAGAIKELRLNNCSIFVTGSNSKLLSSEIVKEFSGRYVSFRVRPFVYKELFKYSRELNKNIDVIDYLIWGGFPKRIEFPKKEDELLYLSNLDETIVINDLINRYKIRKTDLFKRIVDFVMLSNSRIISAKSIADYLKENNCSCSVATVIKYLNYMENAYLISHIPQYTTKTKKVLAYYEKFYIEDVVFNSLRIKNNRFDLSHNLENIVYNELLYRGYEVFVFDNAGKEIDFMAFKDNKTYYVQVALSIAEEKAYNRKMNAFIGLNDLNKKIIITNDEIDYSTSVIHHVKLKDFLMSDDLD